MGNKYKLTVQEFNREQGKASKSYGVLTLISPEGEKYEFTFLSGGWGKGALPGLDGGNINGDDELYSAIYPIGNTLVNKDGTEIAGGKDGYEYEQDKGFFIGLISPEGISRSGFAIHPDGGVEGTLGCVGLAKDECEKFQKLWAEISGQGLAPQELVVLKPSVEDFEKEVLSLKFKDHSVSSIGRYQVSDEVKKLQELIGAKVDGKFGPESMRKAIEAGLGEEVAQMLGRPLDELQKAAKSNNHNLFKQINSSDNFIAEVTANISNVLTITEAKNIGKDINRVELAEATSNGIDTNNFKKSKLSAISTVS